MKIKTHKKSKRQLIVVISLGFIFGLLVLWFAVINSSDPKDSTTWFYDKAKNLASNCKKSIKKMFSSEEDTSISIPIQNNDQRLTGNK